MYKHMLVPIDDTPLASELVGEAVVLAKKLEAKITFFHISAAEDSIYSDAAVMHASDPERYLHRYQWTARALLAKAEAAARVLGVEADSITHQPHGPLHEEIVKAAEARQCDLIAMATHGRSSRVSMYLSSSSIAVMSRTSISFLLLVPGVGGDKIMHQAMGRISEEHRTIEAVMAGLRRLISKRDVHASLEVGEQDVIMGSLRFLSQFAGQQHHPKEEQYLFSKLRERSSEINRLLDELERQHIHEKELLQRVQDALTEAMAGKEVAPLIESIDVLAKHLWQHMAAEERKVFPAARVHLTHDDWEELNEAFSGHTDPQFRVDDEQALRSMYARLINLFPHD